MGSRIFAIFVGLFLFLIQVQFVSAADTQVWQGQYTTGATPNVGTYTFNFTVFNASTGGSSCYSNSTDITTNSLGWWRTYQYDVLTACGTVNNVSVDYYLNINIDGTNQTPRRLLKQLKYADVGENVTFTQDVTIAGTLFGGSPLRFGHEGVSFLNYDRTPRFSIYQAQGFDYNVPTAFANSLVFQTETINNPNKMEVCFWDKELQTMSLCLNEGAPSRATTVYRSFQVVGNEKLPNDADFTVCEDAHFIDCNTSTTGPDVLVGDDIESKGSMFSQENVTAEGYGFFEWLGDIADRITKLFVGEIDASGNVEIGGSLEVSNKSEFYGDVEINGSLEVNGTINSTFIENLQEEIDMLKVELCEKDSNYTWCST